MDARRTARVTEALREELTEMIGYEMEDPRLTGVYVTEVHVSPDLRRALIRVAVEHPEALQALEGARGFLRSELGHRLELHRIPELHFEVEPMANLGDRLPHLLRKIRKGRPREN